MVMYNAKKTTVAVSDMKISSDASETIVAFSLGSCIGVTAYDPDVKVGGILNYMLPDTRNIDAAKVKKFPCMFAETGIPALLRAMEDQGADRERLKIVVAGGAQIMNQSGFYNIGKMNYEVLQKIFKENNIASHHEDVGGNINRTLGIEIGTGISYIRILGQGEKRI